MDKFHSSLIHGPRPRYHASRALVYLGKLEMLQGISLFEPMATGKSCRGTFVMILINFNSHSPFQAMKLMWWYRPLIVTDTSMQGQQFKTELYHNCVFMINMCTYFLYTCNKHCSIDCLQHRWCISMLTIIFSLIVCVSLRGATIEKCAEMLTGKLSLLWGGFTLPIGPLSPSMEKVPPKATKEQIINFFLTMCKSFVHPLIFLRLLRHRLAHPDPENLFDWSTEMKSGSPSPKTTPTSFIPSEQLNVFKVIGRWLEAYPEDFVKYPLLQSEVEEIITRLHPVRGAYLPHTHRLKSLLQDINRPPGETAVTGNSEEKRKPHHENLYKLVSCSQCPPISAI